jgi:hypothetical protein
MNTVVSLDDVSPCSHIEMDQCLRGTYYLHHEAMSNSSQKTDIYIQHREYLKAVFWVVPCNLLVVYHCSAETLIEVRRFKKLMYYTQLEDQSRTEMESSTAQ